MPVVDHVIIAAAGMATRLGLGRPKCLVEFGGIPLIVRTLRLLATVRDVRIVTGFGEREIIDTVVRERKDAVFVRNPAYRSTTTLNSYVLGAKCLQKPCLFLDADILFEQKSFEKMLRRCAGSVDPVIGITKAKTTDAVFVSLDSESNITSFSRTKHTDYEWANVAWLQPEMLDDKRSAVFEHLMPQLPLPAHVIESYEIDTPDDLVLARDVFVRKFNH